MARASGFMRVSSPWTWPCFESSSAAAKARFWIAKARVVSAEAEKPSMLEVPDSEEGVSVKFDGGSPRLANRPLTRMWEEQKVK